MGANLHGSTSDNKTPSFNRLNTVVLWLLCVGVFVLSVSVLIGMRYLNKHLRPPVCISPVAWIAPPPAAPIKVRPDPMRDLRIQCLAAILAKSRTHDLNMVEMNLADSRGVCVVAETIYPRGNVPELPALPAWAVQRATRAINHDD